MKIYYFIHITGTDSGISGVPRVVRNLARELVARQDIELVPVCWSDSLHAIVHAEQKLLDNLSRNGGPEFEESELSRQAVASCGKAWLLIPEVPHLQSHFADYPPVLIDEPIGFARRYGLRVAAMVHDILPLTHPPDENRKRLFADLAADGDELQRLRFVGYAHALVLADLILPVSRTTGALLTHWLVRHGHGEGRLPPIAPVVLPEQVYGVARGVPDRMSDIVDERLEFLSLGTVSAHKNQFSAMSAFQRLVARRPDLNIRLNIVGAVTPDLAASVSLMAKRAKGKIVLHGWLPDPQVRALIKRARATVFVSLAEGYGLPVAESLWYGTPCLCSADGSVGEIARGGGCLTVDPGSLDEIEAGFEALATDSTLHEKLLGELAARKLKSWKRYADEVVDELVAISTGQMRRPASDDGEASTDEYVEDARVRDSAFMVMASDLSVPADFSAASRGHSIHRGSAIRFDEARDGAVLQDILFFGPYVPLAEGRYEFLMDGDLDGELIVAFTGNSGQARIAEVSLTSFDTPISVDLPAAVERFEIVGKRTGRLKSMVLRGAFAQLRPYPPSANETGWTTGASVGRDPDQTAASAPATTEFPSSKPTDQATYVVDDDGRALAPPFDFPAARMRVHDDSLRHGGAISFVRGTNDRSTNPVLFFGPYLHLEPGLYRFRFSGALEGSLKIRFTRDFSSETLRELVVTGFQAPVELVLEDPAEKVEIIGERTRHTKAMKLESIGIAVEPLAAEKRSSRSAGGKPQRRRFIHRAVRFLQLKWGWAARSG